MSDNHMSSPSKVAWTVSEQKAGTITQCLGIALQFDNNPKIKFVKKTGGIKRLFQRPTFRKHEIRPDLIISCGYMPEPIVIHMSEVYKKRPLTVHLQPPKVEGYDLVFVSRHDWNESFENRSNYHSMIGVPHRVTAQSVGDSRAQARKRYNARKDRTVAIFVGGSNGAYIYDDECLKSLQRDIQSLEDQGWRILISVSRRSDENTLRHLLALRSENVEVWDRISENPMLDFFAAADAFLIGRDSVTMPCEALSTGRPVYTISLTPNPGERLKKFERYHNDLEHNLKLTKTFQGELSDYSYEPLNESKRIGGIIKDHIL